MNSATGSVADPGPGSDAFLTPGSDLGCIKNQDPASGIQDEHPGSYLRA
jgi:hypothetical protein